MVKNFTKRPVLINNYMKKIFPVVIIIALVTNLVGTGCTNSKTSFVDSSLYLNNNIQFGDTAMALATKGFITPDIESDETFNLTDKSLFGVNFEKAIAYTTKGRIRVLSYIGKSYNNAKEFESEISKLFPNLCKKYGKPSMDTTYIEKDDVATRHYHEYKWTTPSRVTSVSTYRAVWSFLGGDTYSILAQVEIQDSIIKKHNLTYLLPQ